MLWTGAVTTDAEGRFGFDLRELRPAAAEWVSVARLDELRVRIEVCAPHGERQLSDRGLLGWLREPQPFQRLQWCTDEPVQLSGRAVDLNGAACSGAAVSGKWHGRSVLARTDSRGEFRLWLPQDLGTQSGFAAGASGIVGGIQLRLSDGQGNYAGWLGHPTQLFGEVHVGELTLEPLKDRFRPFTELAALPRGRVLDSEGRPLARWPVCQWIQSGRHAHVWTIDSDEQGWLELPADAPAPYVVAFSIHSKSEPIQPGSLTGEFELRSEGPTVELRIVDPAGRLVRPPSRLRMRSLRPRRSRIPGDEQFIRDDRVLASLPAPDRYTVEYEWEGVVGQWRVHREFDVRDGHQVIELPVAYLPYEPR